MQRPSWRGRFLLRRTGEERARLRSGGVMLVVYGIYKVARRIVAFRNDYCLSCAAPRLAYRHRTFDILHVFWLPVLPLGMWKRWHCSACGNDPHRQFRTSRGMKWLGIALLAFFALVFW